MSQSRAAKIWKRTWVGAALVAVLALLLFLAGRSETGAPVFWSAAVILLGAVYEVGRMGRLSGTGLGLVLLPSALIGLWLVALGMSGPHGALLEPTVDAVPGEARGYEPSFLLESLAAVLLALTSQGLWRLARRGGAMSALGAVVVASYLVLMVFLFVIGTEGPWLEQPGGARLLVLTLALPALWSLLDTLKREEDRRRFTEAGCFALWLVAPLASLSYVWLRFELGGLIALLLLSKIGDIAGYYVGNALGRSHPFPRISPGKTTAGCVASLAAGALAGAAVCGSGLLPGSALAGLGIGAALNLAAQAGDLLESAVKRWAGVKDSGTWFGPSGGVLDLVDSLLLTIPTALLVFPLL